MADPRSAPRAGDPPAPRQTPAERRAERLAAALRENLKRRKAQARERTEAPAPAAEAPLTPQGLPPIA